jgi:hypothetical protein
MKTGNYSMELNHQSEVQPRRFDDGGEGVGGPVAPSKTTKVKYQRRYRERHKEEVRVYQRQYRAWYPEKFQIYRRRYYERHRQESFAYARRRYALKVSDRALLKRVVRAVIQSYRPADGREHAL